MAAAEAALTSGLGPYAILAILLVALIILGCLMDSLSMILLVVPFFWPVISGFDFGMSPEDTKIWFGILALIVVETTDVVFAVDSIPAASGNPVVVRPMFQPSMHCSEKRSTAPRTPSLSSFSIAATSSRSIPTGLSLRRRRRPWTWPAGKSGWSAATSIVC